MCRSVASGDVETPVLETKKMFGDILSTFVIYDISVPVFNIYICSSFIPALPFKFFHFFSHI